MLQRLSTKSHQPPYPIKNERSLNGNPIYINPVNCFHRFSDVKLLVVQQTSYNQFPGSIELSVSSLQGPTLEQKTLKANKFFCFVSFRFFFLHPQLEIRVYKEKTIRA